MALKEALQFFGRSRNTGRVELANWLHKNSARLNMLKRFSSAAGSRIEFSNDIDIGSGDAKLRRLTRCLDRGLHF